MNNSKFIPILVIMKYYLLYNNKKQEKLLTMASSNEKMIEETQFYSSGVWFSYDTKENSNMLENEKEVKGIKFPEQPIERPKFSYKTGVNFLT